MEIVGHTLHTIELCLLSDTFTQIRYQLLSPYLVEDLVFFFFFFSFLEAEEAEVSLFPLGHCQGLKQDRPGRTEWTRVGGRVLSPQGELGKD